MDCVIHLKKQTLYLTTTTTTALDKPALDKPAGRE
jgi:hypothetical protein